MQADKDAAGALKDSKKKKKKNKQKLHYMSDVRVHHSCCSFPLQRAVCHGGPPVKGGCGCRSKASFGL